MRRRPPSLGTYSIFGENDLKTSLLIFGGAAALGWLGYELVHYIVTDQWGDGTSAVTPPAWRLH